MLTCCRWLIYHRILFHCCCIMRLCQPLHNLKEVQGILGSRRRWPDPTPNNNSLKGICTRCSLRTLKASVFIDLTSNQPAICLLSFSSFRFSFLNLIIFCAVSCLSENWTRGRRNGGMSPQQCQRQSRLNACELDILLRRVHTIQYTKQLQSYLHWRDNLRDSCRKRDVPEED